MVDARDAYPQTDQKNVRIRPGYDNLVAVDATSVVASEDIKSVDPKERNCYFGDEVELKAHLYYTQVRIEKKSPPKIKWIFSIALRPQASCLLECRIDYVQELLLKEDNFTCIPWYDFGFLADTLTAFLPTFLQVPPIPGHLRRVHVRPVAGGEVLQGDEDGARLHLRHLSAWWAYFFILPGEFHFE